MFSTLRADHQSTSYPVLLFLVIWTALNLAQGFFTELADDEAYYWAFSEVLNFGYFDHPPMVAWIMALGSSFIEDELGLRLVGILFSTLTLWTLWKLYQSLSSTASAVYFIFAVSSISMFHLYGFISTPDTPLLFFGAWFLMAFKAYLKSNRWVYIIELILVCAALMYSKYHGGLFIMLAFLSQPHLLLRRSFWLIAIFSFVLYLPHLSWQVSENFVTFQYHLFDRSPSDYQLKYTTTYLLNQLLIAGPLMAIPLFYGLTFKKEHHPMNRTLWVILIGFLGFFFFMSFKGHVEPQWNALALFPLILLGLQGLDKKPGTQRWVIGLGTASILMFLAVRLIAINSPVSRAFNLNTELHNNEKWATEIESLSQGKPVIFLNSYQRASKLRYYSNVESASIATTFGRKSQYDLWNSTRDFDGRDLLFTDSRPMIENAAERTIQGKKYYFIYVEDYQPEGKLRVELVDYERIEGTDSLMLKLKVRNNNKNAMSINGKKENLSLYYTYEKGRTKVRFGPIAKLPSLILPEGEAFDGRYKIPTPQNKGEYRLTLSVKNGQIPPNLNGPRFEVTVD